ncbi:hypothetical protein [Lysobacter sp. D1-1-M9]|uniref:hypothetical protein n=1 Tax=Novilysobacter longmucuonensis TaxID=3098603 RepID=UPI002FCBAFB1
MDRNDSIPPFKPASPDNFRQRAAIFADLIDYDHGRLWNLINSEAAYIRMVVLTQAGMPAVAGITHQLDAFLRPLDDKADSDQDAERLADRLRRGIGSMIREVMFANGYQKTGQLRAVPPEPRRIFRRAEVYALAPAVERLDFDWDAFLETARYAEVRRLSPELGRRPPTSMYSPDKRSYFMTSLDLDISCNDEMSLRAMYRTLREAWDAQVKAPYEKPLRLHTLRVDIGEVASMLMELVDNAEEFDHWEVELIESIGNTKRRASGTA